MWDLPGPGLEPVSPALAGRFLITVPPAKSQNGAKFYSSLTICCKNSWKEYVKKFKKHKINKNIASWNMKMTRPSFPKLPRLGMLFLLSIIAGDVEHLLTWVPPLLLLTAKHAGTWNAGPVRLQFSTLCLSGIHRLFHRVWQILSCMLAFLDLSSGSHCRPNPYGEWRGNTLLSFPY